MKPMPSVLLVEDNPITRKLVRFALQHEGVELSEAHDGATALAMAAARRPDLILQDLLLPDMDGFDLVQRMRDIPSVRAVPILAFSGLLSQLDEKRISGSGFTDFVTKPIEPSKLVRIVRAHLPSADAPPASFGAQRRIILADDDEVQRKLSVFRLARLGFDVVDVAEGHAALAAARAHRPDAIVTDAMMPGLDGFGLCAAVRQDAALKDVPIVLVTSTYVDEADRELSRLAGANQFVIRTPDLREMISALQSVLAGGAPPVTSVVVQPPEFERERASRTMVQLERQAAAAASARQQCATLSAELAVLNAISEAITQDQDIEQVLRDILAACCDAGGVSIGALYLNDADGGVRAIVVGGHTSRHRTAAGSFGQGPPALAGNARARVISRDSGAADERAWLERSGLESALVVPLQHKEHSLGALVMMSELADLGLDDRLVFAEAVGHQVSVALTLTRAFADSETAARVAREHASLLESVFTSISDAILVVDAAGQATTWNHAAGQLIGEPALHREQHTPYPDWMRHIRILHADQATPFALSERPVARALAGENVERVEAFLTCPAKPEGMWVSVGARPLLDEAGAVRGAVAVSRDVSAERNAQEQLMISDRMASIGMMAAGVGHEINNPLSAVIANLEMAAAEVRLLADTIGRSRLGDLPDEILEAAEAAQRVRRIAIDLKVFSGGQADENGTINVEDVLDSAVRMGWNQVRQRARVVKHYAGVPRALGAESRLGQVFLNLIVNAAQAIPEGHSDANEIRLATRVDDQGRIVVDIHDTGSGIAPHVMRQLFTPFVTTKPAGVGTGLGLSICQRLVDAMGGSIWADSTPGAGTVFHVALQAAQGLSKGAASPIVATVEPAPPQEARVLVIDDEDMIRMILRRVLKAHQVTAVSSAKEALDLLAGGARYDAIVCDLMMPDMTGVEFHQALSRDHADQASAIMFLTGGAFNRETAAFLESVPNKQLSKPFDAVKLRADVDAHLLARRAAPGPTA
jgi:CheY-like chemotaxis protein/signal transduction histidine kinase